MIYQHASYWTGTEAGDIAAYLRAYSEEPALEVRPVLCAACGGDTFTLAVDVDEGAAKVTCTRCGTEKLLLDSADYWEDADPLPVICPFCSERTHEVQVGLVRRANGDIKWVYVGVRCPQCGLLGSCADWEINYGPTDELERNL